MNIMWCVVIIVKEGRKWEYTTRFLVFKNCNVFSLRVGWKCEGSFLSLCLFLLWKTYRRNSNIILMATLYFGFLCVCFMFYILFLSFLFGGDLGLLSVPFGFMFLLYNNFVLFFYFTKLIIVCLPYFSKSNLSW